MGADTGVMPVLVAIFLALLVAAGVLLAASIAGAAPEGDGSFLHRLRAGWAGRHERGADRQAGGGVAAAPVDLSLAQFLRETVDEGEAYLQVDDLAATLQRARDKAVGVLPSHRDR